MPRKVSFKAKSRGVDIAINVRPAPATTSPFPQSAKSSIPDAPRVSIVKSSKAPAPAGKTTEDTLFDPDNFRGSSFDVRGGRIGSSGMLDYLRYLGIRRDIGHIESSVERFHSDTAGVTPAVSEWSRSTKRGSPRQSSKLVKLLDRSSGESKYNKHPNLPFDFGPLVRIGVGQSSNQSGGSDREQKSGSVERSESVHRSYSVHRSGSVRRSGTEQKSGSAEQICSVQESSRKPKSGSVKRSSDVHRSDRVNQSGSLRRSGREQQSISVGLIGNVREGDREQKRGSVRRSATKQKSGRVERSDSVREDDREQKSGSLRRSGREQKSFVLERSGSVREGDREQKSGSVNRSSSIHRSGSVRGSDRKRKSGRVELSGSIQKSDSVQDSVQRSKSRDGNSSSSVTQKPTDARGTRSELLACPFRQICDSVSREVDLFSRLKLSQLCLGLNPSIRTNGSTSSPSVLRSTSHEQVVRKNRGVSLVTFRDPQSRTDFVSSEENERVEHRAQLWKRVPLLERPPVGNTHAAVRTDLEQRREDLKHRRFLKKLNERREKILYRKHVILKLYHNAQLHAASTRRMMKTLGGMMEVDHNLHELISDYPHYMDLPKRTWPTSLPTPPPAPEPSYPPMVFLTDRPRTPLKTSLGRKAGPRNLQRTEDKRAASHYDKEKG